MGAYDKPIEPSNSVQPTQGTGKKAISPSTKNVESGGLKQDVFNGQNILEQVTSLFETLTGKKPTPAVTNAVAKFFPFIGGSKLKEVDPKGKQNDALAKAQKGFIDHALPFLDA